MRLVCGDHPGPAKVPGRVHRGPPGGAEDLNRRHLSGQCGRRHPLGIRSKAAHGRRPARAGRSRSNLVRDRLAEPDAGDGFLLDGFPRTLPQATALDKLLADLGVALDLVLELVVDNDEVIRRLSGRWTCRGCGKIWHEAFDPPAHEGVCDRCGGELYQRDDDKAETVSERLRVYARDTAPLIDFYGAQGKLVGIDATGPVEDVTERAKDALRSYGV